MAKRRRAPRQPLPGPAVSRSRRRAPEPERGRLPYLRIVLVVLAAVGVFGVVGLAFFSSATARNYSCDELLAAPAGPSGSDGISTKNLGQTHVGVGTKIRYGFCPPTSASHYNAAGKGPLRPGFYSPDSDAGPSGWVHNLEHGYVVALYRCANGSCPPESDLAALRSFATNAPPTQSAVACGYRSKVLVARFDDMSTAYALLAWDRALLLDIFESSTARDFARAAIEATAPEPNAC